VEFTWDEHKNRVNQRKHGVSFETAILVFNDPFQVSRQDRVQDGEERWQTIGTVRGMHVLVVAHTVEDDDNLIRIISARKATPQERIIYAQG
jgi:uncharacterized DUF497 family protein